MTPASGSRRQMNNWLTWSLLSALFAGATAILVKIGLWNIGLLWAAMSMFYVLSKLERQGLVVRPAQPPVGRALPAELTARGRRQLTVASAAVRRVEHDMLANLDTGEQDHMRHLLTACIAALTQPPASAT